VTGTPGLSIEVKARTDFNPVGWLKQAKRNAGHNLAMVVFRPNGVGDNAEDYLAVLRFGDLMEVIGNDFGQELTYGSSDNASAIPGGQATA
jgi:hypothetical protein